MKASNHWKAYAGVVITLVATIFLSMPPVQADVLYTRPLDIPKSTALALWDKIDTNGKAIPADDLNQKFTETKTVVVLGHGNGHLCGGMDPTQLTANLIAHGLKPEQNILLYACSTGQGSYIHQLQTVLSKINHHNRIIGAQGRLLPYPTNTGVPGVLLKEDKQCNLLKDLAQRIARQKSESLSQEGEELYKSLLKHHAEGGNELKTAIAVGQLSIEDPRNKFVVDSLRAAQCVTDEIKEVWSPNTTALHGVQEFTGLSSPAEFSS